MTTSIEKIKARSTKIKNNRSVLLNKLKRLQETLLTALDEIEIYATTSQLHLESIGPDDWCYGHLTYSQGKLFVSYRTTEDDLEELRNNVPEEYQSFNKKDLEACSIEWLEKIASEKTLNQLLANIEKELEYIDGSSSASVHSLNKILDSQSNILSSDLIDELKLIDDDKLYSDWLKAHQMVHIDPSDSITRSSSYLESVCRLILTKLSKELPSTKTISTLISAVSDALELSENKDANDDLKKLFGGVKSIFQAVGTMRTHFGTAHGSSPGDYEIDEHYARLANNAAACVSIFILQRFKIKMQSHKQ